MAQSQEILTAKERRREYLPWVEKYRPKNINEIAAQGEVVATLKKSLESANLPHLLFYGPAGTGKTSTILAVARQLYGPELMKSRVLELNASDERGIKAVRTKIKQFAQLAVGKKDPKSPYPCPPYKIIILDESDAMTRDAQSALRRTMELYSKVTRFCLICNYISRIIAPVASRCAKFRFKPLDIASCGNKLKEVAGHEKLLIGDGTVGALVDASGGDMRKAITLLQSSSRMKMPGEEVTVADVERVTVRVPPSVVSNMMAACGTNKFETVQTAARDTCLEGYPIAIVFDQLTDAIVETDKLKDEHKARVCIRLGEADRKLADGADEYLQILNVLSFLTQQMALASRS